MKCLDMLKGVGLVGLGVSLFMVLLNLLSNRDGTLVWGICGLVSASYLVLWALLKNT